MYRRLAHLIQKAFNKLARRQADLVSFVRRPAIGTVRKYVAKHNTRKNVDSWTFDEISKVFVPDTKLRFILLLQLKRRKSAAFYTAMSENQKGFSSRGFHRSKPGPIVDGFYMYDIHELFVRIIRVDFV